MSDDVKTAAVEGANTAADGAQSAYGKVSSVDAGDVKTAAVEGANTAADGAQSAYERASDYIKNPETQAIIGEGFGKLDKAYSMTVNDAKEGIMIASGMASAGCMALIPLLRLEIFRDFTQIMGVVFGSAYVAAQGLMYGVVSAFGGAFNIVTLNLGAAFQTEQAAQIGFIIAIILGVISLVLYLAYFFQRRLFHGRRQVRRKQSRGRLLPSARRRLFGSLLRPSLCPCQHIPVCQVVAQVLLRSRLVQYQI